MAAGRSWAAVEPPPPPGAIAARVVGLLREQTGIEAIGLGDDLAGELGLDWLGRIDLIEALEASYLPPMVRVALRPNAALPAPDEDDDGDEP